VLELCQQQRSTTKGHTMIATTTTTNGQHIATAKVNGKTFTTKAYYTLNMALADAKCWIAFNKTEGTEMFEARDRATHIFYLIAGTEVARRIEEAKSFGLTVETKISSHTGREYIEISNGKGSSYGQYFKVAA
jgi:hypothetical protein